MIPRPCALAVLVAGKKASGILGGIPPAEPRIENTECSLDETKGKNKTDLPTQLKVANRSIFVAEGSPARDGAQRSEREKGGKGWL